MGTQQIGLMGTQPRSTRSGFMRTFIWYCVGILIATCAVTFTSEIALFLGFMLDAKRKGFITYDPALSGLRLWSALIVPVIALLGSIVFFAWRMGRAIRQPVTDLMQAVEKIRQQDLDFTITYHANNELGDLCDAFNELRRELQASLEREWRKQEEIRMMIAALSHDLRTPVTIIQGHIESLSRTEAGEKRNERLERYLPVLASSSQRMTRLLNDILVVSALEETGFLMHPEPTDIEEALRHKADVFTLQAASAGITFCYQMSPPSVEVSPVKLDFHRIEQVLDNLFENALRYTPTDGQIVLTCACKPNALTMVLRDSGGGIALADLPHVWEKFYHGHIAQNNHTRQTTGLGLYTCKLLIERHGGVITLRNHPEGGCEVTISLPIEDVESGKLLL